MKILKIGYTVIASLIAIIILIVNIRILERPGRDVEPQLASLKERVHAGLGEKMQKIYPEGFVFTYALYGLAWMEYARAPGTPASQRTIAVEEAEWARAKIESEKGKNRFDPSLNPPFGIFYTGWKNFLLASILRVKSRTEITAEDSAAFESSCDEIVRSIQFGRSPYPESFRNASWPADAFPAIASLSIHDRIFQARYGTIIDRWLSRSDSLRDTAAGLIPHSVDAESGRAAEGPRGSSQALILRLMPEIDPVRASTDYTKFRKHFLSSVLGLPVITEYPKGDEGTGDVDSGPVVAGIGTAGTIVAIGAARANGDTLLSGEISRCVEAFGFPLTIGSKKSYAFGAFPMGELFLCWSMAAVPPGASGSFGTGDRYSFVFFHLGSLIILFAISVPFIRRSRSKGSK